MISGVLHFKKIKLKCLYLQWASMMMVYTFTPLQNLEQYFLHCCQWYGIIHSLLSADIMPQDFSTASIRVYQSFCHLSKSRNVLYFDIWIWLHNNNVDKPRNHQRSEGLKGETECFNLAAQYKYLLTRNYHAQILKNCQTEM